jgi:hypothetical protein
MSYINYFVLFFSLILHTENVNGADIIEPQNSKKLSVNMEANGTKRPPQTIAHHIVGSGQRAKPARDILVKHKIDIDSHLNGVFLPDGKNSAAPGYVHTGRHTNEYIDRVNTDIVRADGAGGKPAVVKQLEMIREQLLSKTYTPLQKDN